MWLSASFLLGEYASFVLRADREHYDCGSPVHTSDRLLSAGIPAGVCCTRLQEQTSYHIEHKRCSFGREPPGSAVEVKVGVVKSLTATWLHSLPV